MSKISDLISAKKEVNFRGEKIMIDGSITLADSQIITKAFAQPDIRIKAEGIKELIFLMASKVYPNATAEEISKIDHKYSDDFLEVFYQIDETANAERNRIKKILEKVSKVKK